MICVEKSTKIFAPTENILLDTIPGVMRADASPIGECVLDPTIPEKGLAMLHGSRGAGKARDASHYGPDRTFAIRIAEISPSQRPCRAATDARADCRAGAARSSRFRVPAMNAAICESRGDD